ncbi:MAG TPA: hypothetical protein VM284_00795 [Candidatus Limnocylindria bacterium]|nr:hypothetical protein [Candidatus Limnocylindria bacterium]
MAPGVAVLAGGVDVALGELEQAITTMATITANAINVGLLRFEFMPPP